MEKKKQQPVNFIWKPLCLAFAALLVLSWVFFGVLCGKGGVDFSSLEIPEQIQADNGSPVTNENGEQLPSDETVPMPKAMTFRSAASLDTQEAAYDSVTLTATVKPDYDYVDKTVDWSVAFVNPASEWATGKTVTDYVTVTPTGDGALTATVQCLQPFGEQIKITVTSRDNPNAKADCTVDFSARNIGLHFEVTNASGETITVETTDKTHSVTMDEKWAGELTVKSIRSLKSVGTVNTGDSSLSDIIISDTQECVGIIDGNIMGGGGELEDDYRGDFHGRSYYNLGNYATLMVGVGETFYVDKNIIRATSDGDTAGNDLRHPENANVFYTFSTYNEEYYTYVYTRAMQIYATEYPTMPILHMNVAGYSLLLCGGAELYEPTPISVSDVTLDDTDITF